MAGGMYSAGKVGVDIVPDTSGFWALLHAELSSRRPEVTVDVNMRGVAQAESTLSRLDGRTLTNVVRIEGDDSGLRRIDRMIRQQRLLWEKRPITSKYDLDDRPFISKITRLASTVEDGTERVSSFVRQSDRSVTDTLRDNITSLRKTQSEYDREVTEATRRRERLINDEKAAYDMYAEAIDANRVRIERLTKSSEDANRTLEWSKRRMKELRAEGDTAGADWFKNTRIPELREQIKGFTAQIREAKKEIRDYKKEQDKLYTADFDNRVAEQTRKIEDGTRKWEESVDAIREYSSQLKDSKLLQDEFAQSTDRMTSMFRKSLDVQKQADILARQQAQTLPRLTEGQRMLADVLGDVDGKYTDLDGAMSDSRRAMDQQRRTARDLTDVFDEQGNAVRDLMQAFERFKPMGIDSLTGQQLNQTIKQLDALKEYAVRHPIEAKLRMDTGDWDRSYTDVMFKAEKLRAKLERDHEVDVRVKVWEDSADRLEQRLERLRHTRVDIPVDWQVEQEGLITAMRETAAKIKADPSRRWELEADLDVSMHTAEEKLRKFEDEHDELKMDLDLETALARAHLAYFTRPRTVDVFANFKGTDLGKILTGMTSGATGLKGVQNQFDNLVNTFDKLDKVVPKWSLLGAGLTSLGAGLLNLGRTVGGVGVSLASMSKAALAAPAALAGLASAGYVGYRIFGDLKERFDVTQTALADLNHQLGDSAWDEYGDDLYRLADDIAPTLTRGLNGIAVEEGKVLDGLISVVRQSDETRQLPNIFDNTRTAVANLNPGLQSLARAFLGLGDQTSQYLPRMASYISNVADYWARWVDTASKTGQIGTAMEKAIEQGGYLKSSVMDLTGVITGLFRPLAEDQNGLQTFAENIHKADEAVNSVRFQETLTAWVDGATAAQQGMRNAFKDVGDAFYSLKDVTRDVFSDAGQIVGSGITAISRVLQQSKNGIRDFSNGIRDGFTEAFDAIGDAGPMFSDLASMVGQLSRTFGGTFAASLKAAAPLITAIAKGAEVLSSAFAKLPEPVQAAMGLWVTFGRAGMQAFTSLKTGMLQNIQQTMQYQKMLGELGLSADKAGVSMRTLVSALNQVRSGSYAGALSGAVAEVNALGTAAQSSSRKILAVNAATKETAGSTLLLANSSGKMTGSIENIGNSASKTVGKFSGLKSAASGLVGLLGGPWGAAATAAFMGISAAAADYTAKSQATQEATQNIANAMNNVSFSATKAGTAISNISQQMVAAFANKDYAEGGSNWLASTGLFGPASNGNDKFKDTASAAKQLGITLNDLSTVVKNGGSAYDEYSGNLFKNTKFMDDNYKAAKKVQQSASQMITDMRDQIETTADANGHSRSYIDTLMSLGNATDFMALKAKSFTEQQADYVAAGQLAAQTATDETNARIRAAQANSSYEKTLASVGSAIAQVNALAAQGQQVWDVQAKSFDFTTEAGRTASDTLTSLASSANSYLQAMIDNGASYDQVSAEQKKMKDSLSDTANQLTNNAEGASAYADSLLMTPDTISTQIELHAEEAKNNLLQYIGLLEKTFPNSKNGQAAFNTVLNMAASGAISSMDEVLAKKNELLKGLRDGTMVITVDADGNQAVMSLKTVQELGGKLQDGAYKVSISAEDAATPNIEKIVGLLSQSGLDGKQITMFLNAEGNAKLSIDDVRNALTALGMDPKDIEILLNAEGDAPEQTALVKQKLEELGATPKQIEWFLKAIDQTSDGTGSAQENIDNVQQRQPASIKAQDDTGEGTSSAQRNIDLVKQGTPAPIDASDNTPAPTDNAKRNIDSVKGKRVNVDAATGGLAGVQNLAGAINGLQDKTVTITTNFMRNFIDNYMKTGDNYAPGVSLHPASGGRIFGPGTGTSDSIPAMVSNGEMVIRASSVKKLDKQFGKDFLDSLNAYGKVPAGTSPAALKYRARSQAYAAGGRVIATKGMPEVTSVVNNIVQSNENAMDEKTIQAAVASGFAAALKANQMKLAFDARGAARVMAEPMSREMGMLEKSGRMR
ncbi:hypothetical protein [Bifidobacterium myosotis]|uniref:Uncharacterized protein n=1 Tax=Bifidobacterium myosotis TaxID=1630166 RepID=A0A5M9ZI14_9BIFI|nr:hypothetical protein [Bifidobacterium myosotis]KAA8827254.1 hypothetical protein EMO91_09435 [Bifidobacterium myosotis]